MATHLLPPLCSCSSIHIVLNFFLILLCCETVGYQCCKVVQAFQRKYPHVSIMSLSASMVDFLQIFVIVKVYASHDTSKHLQMWFYLGQRKSGVKYVCFSLHSKRKEELQYIEKKGFNQKEKKKKKINIRVLIVKDHWEGSEKVAKQRAHSAVPKIEPLQTF